MKRAGMNRPKDPAAAANTLTLSANTLTVPE
jgi:hypothetical protein